MFSVVFRLLNINISAHRIENIERCKHYSASLILFGLKIVVLCSGEYVGLLKWKFWKCIMEMLILYYSGSQGSALLGWTQQKLLVDFCQGNVLAGAVPHTIPSHFGMTGQWGKWNSAVWAYREVRDPHGCWRQPCTTSSWSAREIPREDRLAQPNMCKAGGQINVQGRLLLLKIPLGAFLFCLLAVFLLVFPGFLCERGWSPGCPRLSETEQSCSALCLSQAVPAQHRAQHPRDYCFWFMATAEVHCQNQNFWPGFLFLTFHLICFYFILQLWKHRVLKWRLGVLEKSCVVSRAPVPEVSFWGRSVIRHETGNTSSHLMGFSLVEEQRY